MTSEPSEPTYVYVRGQGWVVETNFLGVVFDRAGKPMRVYRVDRPKPGDLYFNSGYLPATLDHMLNHASQFLISEWGKWRGWGNHSKNDLYYVLVPE